MSELEVAPDERIVGQVSTFRVVTADGRMRDEVRTDDGAGGELDLPTAVGMLAVAQHILLLTGEGE